jgi:hypothetical protein
MARQPTTRRRRRGVRSRQTAAVDAGGPVSGLGSRSSQTIWAYAYQILPPQTKSRLRAVIALLNQEHSAAHDGSRTWAGRLILGARMTSILIVSSSLDRIREVNQRLEAELKHLKVDVAVTEPVALPGTATSASP